MEALKRVALNTETTHAELEARLHDAFVYFRFNVDQDLDDGTEASVVHSHTSTYLEETLISRRLDEVMRSIHTKPKGVSLKELS